MDLPEYESKELIAQFGVKIPDGRIVGSPEEAEEMARAKGQSPHRRAAMYCQLLIHLRIPP